MNTALSYEGPSLPLSSLRLIVPPLQLVSAALCEILKQGAVVHYGLLEEFVTGVLETVPELLPYSERVQLVMGLRAKVVLEVCSSSTNLQMIQPHLTRLNAYLTKMSMASSDSVVKESVTRFCKLVQTLVDNPSKDSFYQTTFPEVFGPKYDTALHNLMRKFIFRLQKMLPVPNLEQTAHCLSLSTSVLKECMEFVTQPQPLNTLIQHHKHHGQELFNDLSYPGDNCILSSLSFQLEIENEEEENVTPTSKNVIGDWSTHGSFGSKSNTGRYEHLEERDSKSTCNVGRGGECHGDVLSDIQAASIEISLPLESNLDNNTFCLSESFKSQICGQGVDSLVEHSHGDHNLLSCACGKEFIYRKSFDKHQKNCRFSSKYNTLSKLRCSSKLTMHSTSIIADCTVEHQSRDSDMLHSDMLPNISLSIEHLEEQLCSNSSAETPSKPDALSDSKLPLKCYACGQGFKYYKKLQKHKGRCLRKGVKNTKHLVILACNDHFLPDSVKNKQCSEDKECSEIKGGTANPEDSEVYKSKPHLKCTICEKTFSKLIDMKNHYSQSHKITNSYPCHLCKITFVRLCELVRHHRNKKQYQCCTCKKCFKRLSHLYIHKTTCTAKKTPHVCKYLGILKAQIRGEQRQRCICSNCGKQVRNHAGLKAHMVQHTAGYPCPICGKKFNQKTCLKRHQCKHTGKNPYVCVTCGKVWPTAAQLKRHMEKRPFKCEDCGKCYKRRNHLFAHRQTTHTKTRQFVCSNSNRRPQAATDFTKEKALNNTANMNEERVFSLCSSAEGSSQPGALSDSATSLKSLNSKFPLKCDKSGQKFTYKSFEKHEGRCTGKKCKNKTNTNHLVILACNFHLTDHAVEKDCLKTGEDANTGDCSEVCNRKPQIKCTMCEKSFPEITDMEKHYFQSHQITSPYPCPLCKNTFVRLCELVRHHQNTRQYQCSTCNKCFRDETYLSKHENHHIAKKATHICETCGKRCMSSSHLTRHRTKHIGEEQQQSSICSHCGKQYANAVGLKAHMVQHTGGHLCPVCGTKFNQKTYLKWHQYKHKGQETYPYLCDTCGKGCPTAAQLKQHMVHHTEERPFKCADCGACFKRSSTLVAHHRTAHLKMRPFVCQVCSKSFRFNCELKIHSNIHTGERPYVCQRCEKRFTARKQLMQHQRKSAGC